MSLMTKNSFWFDPNPKLAIACGIISYGEHVDEFGNHFISACTLQGEKFRIYGASKAERSKKYHKTALALIQK